MSKAWHDLATAQMFEADYARARGDTDSERRALLLAADYEDQAVQSLQKSGLDRPRTQAILRRSAEACRAKADRL